VITFGLPRSAELAPIRNTGTGVNTGVNKAAAGPSTRTRATSRETAADTPAETATLQGEREEDGADSDAGSSYGDPDAEALGRKSNEEREIDAQVRANLKSENATLLKRVKALEEHNQLLERIQQL
jgi:hypothetical protein